MKKELKKIGKRVTKKVEKWLAMSKTLAELKAPEMTLRKEIVRDLFDGVDKGTHYAELPKNYKLKVVVKETEKLDDAAFLQIRDKLSEGAEDICIKWTPTLIKKGYNELCDKDKKLIDSVKIISQASPEVKVIPPKEK